VKVPTINRTLDDHIQGLMTMTAMKIIGLPGAHATAATHRPAKACASKP